VSTKHTTQNGKICLCSARCRNEEGNLLAQQLTRGVEEGTYLCSTGGKKRDGDNGNLSPRWNIDALRFFSLRQEKEERFMRERWSSQKGGIRPRKDGQQSLNGSKHGRELGRTSGEKFPGQEHVEKADSRD